MFAAKKTVLTIVWLAAAALPLCADNPVGNTAPPILSPQESLRSMTVPDGYEINLFASEAEFPIANVVAMKWDRRGRLWVANIPSFPQVKPDQPYPDSIVILEDTDGDGRADKHTVFADKLYLPLGFVISDQGHGVYVSSQPYLLHLIDTDGDDVADRRDVVLQGFGSEDSHHGISAFQWSPDGSFYMADGTFLVSNVETPWGPRRVHDSGVFRFKPSSGRVDVFGNYAYSNPWGITFDRWGHPVLMDASGGQNYYLPHLMQNFAYEQIPPTQNFLSTGKITELVFFQKGRPNCGAAFISSRNFPDEVQGTYLNGQMVGFNGLRWVWTQEHGSGYRTTQVRDLITSTDQSFRPVDLNFGPDGALYVADFYNPVVGHMTYEFRDPKRDQTHGRIWRVRYKDRPLEKFPKFAGQPVEQVLDLLKDPTLGIRWHALRELQERDPKQVLPAVDRWIATLDRSHPDYELRLLDAFWVYQGHDELNKPLLERLLTAKEGNVRASAARALRFEMHRYGDAMPWLGKLVFDPHMRVRLEAVNALSYTDSPQAAKLILEASSKLPMDVGLYWAMKRSLAYLTRVTGTSLENTVFEVRDLPSKELLSRLQAGFTDAVGYESLRRNDIPAAVHEEVFARFERHFKADRVTTLFRVAQALADQGVTDVSGISRRLASVTAQQAAAGRSTLLERVQRQDDAEIASELRKAAYAGLLLDDSSDAKQTLLLAQRRNELELLAAGAAMISDAPTQQRLLPVFLDYLNENPGANHEVVRDLLTGPLLTAGQVKPLFVTLAGLAEKGNPALRRGTIAAMQRLPYGRWPAGYDPYAGRLKVAPQKLQLGLAVFRREGMCGTCHQEHGKGVPGAFPPLTGSPWVEGDAVRLIKVAQAGLIGPLEVNGVPYNTVMPPLGILLNDDEMAAVLTYIRTAWDNIGSEITAEQVKQVRAQMGNRFAPWAVQEILSQHPLK